MNQNEKVLHHLKVRGGLTARHAFIAHDIQRLSGRIYELRKLGHKIRTVRTVDDTGKKIGVYRLIKSERERKS